MNDCLCPPPPEFLVDEVDNNGLKRLLLMMMRIREFEERLAELVTQKKIITPCHLYTGQEAVAAGRGEGTAQALSNAALIVGGGMWALIMTWIWDCAARTK